MAQSEKCLLWQLATDGDVGGVRDRLRGYPDEINGKSGPQFTTALMQACSNNHSEVVKLLLEDAGININVRDKNNSSCIHWAARSSPLSLALILSLANQANVKAELNGEDNQGDTPLHVAARYGQLSSCSILLAAQILLPAGQDVLLKQQNHQLKTSENLAYDNTNYTSNTKTWVLLQNASKMSSEDSLNEHLETACEWGLVAVAQTLITKGARPKEDIDLDQIVGKEQRFMTSETKQFFKQILQVVQEHPTTDHHMITSQGSRMRQCSVGDGSTTFDFNMAEDIEKAQQEATTRGQGVKLGIGEDEYQIVNDIIGRGRSGIVYRTSSSEVCAKKITSKAKWAIDEVRFMQRQDNNFIVKYLDFKKGEHIWVLMEYCSLGNLKEYMAYGESVNTGRQIRIIHDCAQGLAYLHNQGVTHRSITPEYIVLKYENNDNVAKLCNLSLAVEQVREMNEIVGSDVHFKAPELFQSCPEYDKSIDTYALGLIALCMLQYDTVDDIKKWRPCTDAYYSDTPLPENYCFGREILGAMQKKKTPPVILSREFQDCEVVRRYKVILRNTLAVKATERKEAFSIANELGTFANDQLSPTVKQTVKRTPDARNEEVTSSAQLDQLSPTLKHLPPFETGADSSASVQSDPVSPTTKMTTSEVNSKNPPEPSESSKYTSIWKMARDCYPEALEDYLKTNQKENINQRGGEMSTTSLMEAAADNNYDVFSILLEHGASVNIDDKKDASCVHYAAESSPKCLKLLFDKHFEYVKEEVCRQDQHGNTPLHWAARNGQLQCCKLLLKAGGHKALLTHNFDKKYPDEVATGSPRSNVVTQEFLEYERKRGEGVPFTKADECSGISPDTIKRTGESAEVDREATALDMSANDLQRERSVNFVKDTSTTPTHQPLAEDSRVVGTKASADNTVMRAKSTNDLRRPVSRSPSVSSASGVSDDTHAKDKTDKAQQDTTTGGKQVNLITTLFNHNHKAYGKYEYKVIDCKLGQGRSGIVYRTTDPDVCAKKITSNVKMAIDEVRFLMQRQDNQFIVKYLDFSKGEDVWVLMEQCSLGNLKEYMADGEPANVERQIRIIDDCAHGLAYLHNQGVTHRSITPEYIVLKYENNDNVAKLCNLSLAVEQVREMTKAEGTEEYWAPELFAAKPDYDNSIDTFALGLIALCMLSYEAMDDYKKWHPCSAGFWNETPLPGNYCIGRELFEAVENQTILPTFIPRADADSDLVVKYKDILQKILTAKANERLDAGNVAAELLNLKHECSPTIRSPTKHEFIIKPSATPYDLMEKLEKFLKDNKVNAKVMFGQFDKTRKGKIKKEDFNNGFKHYKKIFEDDELKVLFDTICTNVTGGCIEYSDLSKRLDAHRLQRRQHKSMMY